MLEAEPTRAAWHRAAATAGRDEAVALGLDAVATTPGAAGRSHPRSQPTSARAAQRLTPQDRRAPAPRCRVGGGARAARRRGAAPGRGRIAGARSSRPGPGRVGAGDERPGPAGRAGPDGSLIDGAASVAEAGDAELALRLLWAAATSGFWADRENELSDEIVALAERLPVRRGRPVAVGRARVRGPGRPRRGRRRSGVAADARSVRAGLDVAGERGCRHGGGIRPRGGVRRSLGDRPAEPGAARRAGAGAGAARSGRRSMSAAGTSPCPTRRRPGASRRRRVSRSGVGALPSRCRSSRGCAGRRTLPRSSPPLPSGSASSSARGRCCR